MRVAICFTNFGPYHLARLRALGEALAVMGGELLAYEVAGKENRYPWSVARGEEPFEWTTFFPDRPLESLGSSECSAAMRKALRRDQPEVVAITGYTRAESMAALAWSNRHRKQSVLLSETQRIDHPRVWWKEALKRDRVRRFSAALVGGCRHKAYLVELGMPSERIVLGYNAVDNQAFALAASVARSDPTTRSGLPARPYFFSVNRFVPEKNLARLVRAYGEYRRSLKTEDAWDLVLCGDGPLAGAIAGEIASRELAESVHCPGFIQAKDQGRWHGNASAFVHPSLMEPWGLVVNEAAAAGLPLLVSNRAGCVETLVPEPDGTTGARFNPGDESAIAQALYWMSGQTQEERLAMGRRAASLVEEWGPGRFASGMIEAIERARDAERTRRRTTKAAVAAAAR